MEIKFAPMGEYQTNCYIITHENKQIIIDPGQDAKAWLRRNLTNPKAILNTHGHHDHMWSDSWLKEEYGLPIYCPKGDAFMLKSDVFSFGITPVEPDFEVTPDEEIELIGQKVKFWHFPGHSPGSTAIEIGDVLFSGDFVFKNTIGRCDFPYSNKDDMKKSIEKILTFEKDLKVYPGHGASTTLKQEQKFLPSWLEML